MPIRRSRRFGGAWWQRPSFWSCCEESSLVPLTSRSPFPFLRLPRPPDARQTDHLLSPLP
ncbi:hypothetical protein RMHFA_05619 (plasmid) [Roseomonas mucosa]|nr:hypothetical protein RMP42_05619 [Roseomonas mucosa]UZO99069.1 hypothetical protein RMHFA_05619 [Roseomonas mucosa]